MKIELERRGMNKENSKSFYYIGNQENRRSESLSVVEKTPQTTQ